MGKRGRRCPRRRCFALNCCRQRIHQCSGKELVNLLVSFAQFFDVTIFFSKIYFGVMLEEVGFR